MSKQFVVSTALVGTLEVCYVEDYPQRSSDDHWNSSDKAFRPLFAIQWFQTTMAEGRMDLLRQANYSGSGPQYNAQGEYIAQGNARQYNSGGGPMHFGED